MPSRRISILAHRLVGTAALALAALPLAATAQTAAPAAAPAAQRPATQRPPNIILILADDIGTEAINAYGGQYYTPRIDELARRGVRMDNAHATPLCTPSRVRIMTGKESHRNYTAFGYLDPKERTFAHMLKDAGYTTGIVGKWQLSGNAFDKRTGATPQQAGFDTSFLWQLESRARSGSRYWGPTLSDNGKTTIYESGFGPDMMNDRAMAFIEENKAKPFFLYYTLPLPHDPFVPTPDQPNATGDQPRFAAMVSYLDKLVGNVTDKVRSLGLEQDTLILFAGDNGTSTKIVSKVDGVEVQGGKGKSTLAGTHVPFVASWPGHIPEGRTSAGMVDFTDVLPTIAHAAGVAVPAGIDGKDQMDVFAGRKPAARDWIFMHYAPVWIAEPARFIFDGQYKLYGDGKFVALDPRTSTETPVTGRTGAARRAQFQKLLDNMGDGPLNPVRYPMCANRPSVDPARPAIEAGCDRVRSLDGE